MQAGVYAGTLHYLKAVEKVGSPADGKAVVEAMKAMPTDDPLFGPGQIRADGRKLHPMYLLQVKTPAESKSEWDVFKVAGTIPADKAFRPLKEGRLPPRHQLKAGSASALTLRPPWLHLLGRCVIMVRYHHECAGSLGRRRFRGQDVQAGISLQPATKDRRHLRPPAYDIAASTAPIGNGIIPIQNSLHYNTCSSLRFALTVILYRRRQSLRSPEPRGVLQVGLFGARSHGL